MPSSRKDCQKQFTPLPPSYDFNPRPVRDLSRGSLAVNFFPRANSCHLFISTITDQQGNVTDYDHDSRGLEVQRIEAKGTPQQRDITTLCHTDFRLPVKITEPDRVIDFTYDPQGLLLERKETPTP